MYILIYSIFYFFTKLEITEFIPTLLYMGYTGIFLYLILITFKTQCVCAVILPLSNHTSC